MELPGAIRGENHDWWRLCDDSSYLGDGDLEVRQQLEEERFEFIIRTVDLVNQQNTLISGPNCFQEGTLEEELCCEEPLDGILAVNLVFGQGANMQHLTGIVPLVQGLICVDALITLETDQAAVQDGGQHLGELGLAHTDLTLK